MIQHKYGSYTNEQFNAYKNRLHGSVHWLLIYAEQNSDIIDKCFDRVQCKLEGLNELLCYPTQIVEIMNLVESARIEYNRENYSHSKYRKLILDIHELIDKLPEGD